MEDYSKFFNYTKKPVPITWIFFISLVAIFYIQGHDFYWTWKLHEDLSGEIAENVETGTMNAKIAFSTLGLFSIIYLIFSHRKRLSFDKLTIFQFILFAGWAALSIIWAANQYLAIRRVFAAFLLCLGAFACAKRFTFRDILYFAFFISSVTLIVSVFTEIFLGTFHPFDANYRFAGTQHPNLSAESLSIMVLSGITLGDLTRRFRALFFSAAVISILFIFLTRSRTSLYTTFICMAIYIGIRKPFYLLIIFLITVPLFTFLVIFFPNYFASVVLLGRPVAEAGSLTYRFPMWKYLMNYVFKEPMTGYGFNAFWTEDIMYAMKQKLGFYVLHAHNTYLDVILGIGLFGLLFYLFILVRSTISSVRLRSVIGSKLSSFCLVILIYYWFLGCFESAFFQFTPSYFIFLIIIAKVSFFKNIYFINKDVSTES